VNGYLFGKIWFSVKNRFVSQRKKIFDGKKNKDYKNLSMTNMADLCSIFLYDRNVI